MKMWEAMMKVSNGFKVRKNCWEEGRYVYSNRGSLMWENGSLVEELIDDGTEWEVYSDKPESVDKFWKEFHDSIMNLAGSYQEMLNSCGGECGNCPFREACARYDDLYHELTFINDEYLR